MKKYVFYLLFFVTFLQAGSTVVSEDQDYFTSEVRNTELIYTQKNLPYAKHTAKVEMQLQRLYEESFAYKMDEKLYVGLLSDYNQIANGFSTPFPYNMQMNYIGGSLESDYFSSKSWLDTLLYHETAHNYQINSKNNIVSKSLHAAFKNGFFFFPWFSYPNIVESSFLLEGNAVLNESWHGNGGRLYSGRFKVETLLQAKAGKLTPELVYNDNLHFLYGSHFYTLGAYFEYYLMQKYGLKRVNSYWQAHSKEWFFPFFTNYTTKSVFGKDFETLISQWGQKLKAESNAVTETKGTEIASSQFFSQLNADKNEIYFTINHNGREKPKLLCFDKKTKKVTRYTEEYLQGKVFKTLDKKYATLASSYVTPYRIYIGLYGENARLINGTKSKIIQGYMSDKRAIYFDVNASFDEPHLYIGKKYYTTVNSSVYINHNDLYYFKQKHKTRTLYKNKKAIFSLQGYYSHVVGVDKEDGIYFIANSKYGSTLYRFKDKKFQRMTPADTIIDARLINETQALVASVKSDRYSYEILNLNAVNTAPYEVKLKFKDKPQSMKKEAQIRLSDVNLDRKYNSLLDMHYSGANIMLSSDTKAGFLYDVSLGFSDPLSQNALSLFIRKNLDSYTLGGFSYENSRYFINYFISTYAVLERPDEDYTQGDKREYGVSLNAAVELLKEAYTSAKFSVSYYRDYESNTREPLSSELSFMKYEQFGYSLYPNYELSVAVYASNDRGDMIYGAKSHLKHDLFDELYLGASLKYSKTDAPNAVNDRGVKIATYLIETDPSRIVMPSLRYSSVYVKEALKTGLELKKVFNYDAYFFTFPVSLRREALYLLYNNYKLKGFGSNKIVNADEVTLGLLFDTLFFNKLLLPISVEYLHNSNKNVAYKERLKVNLGITF
ncbi:hypothetical protein [Sulfurimonas sp.]